MRDAPVLRGQSQLPGRVSRRQITHVRFTTGYPGPADWLHLTVNYEYPELQVIVSKIPNSAASKVGVAKMSGALASLALGLTIGSLQLNYNHHAPAPIAAVILGLAQGALAQEEDYRYVVQVTTPKACVAEFSGNVNLQCSFGANLVDCPVTAASPARSPPPSPTASVSWTPSASAVSVSSTPSASPSPVSGISVAPTISVTPTPAISVSPMISVSPTISVLPGSSGSSTTSVSPTISLTSSVSVSASILQSATRSVSVSASISQSATSSVSVSASISQSATSSVSVSASILQSASPTISVSPTISLTRSVSSTPSSSPPCQDAGLIYGQPGWYLGFDKGNNINLNCDSVCANRACLPGSCNTNFSPARMEGVDTQTIMNYVVAKASANEGISITCSSHDNFTDIGNGDAPRIKNQTGGTYTCFYWGSVRSEPSSCQPSGGMQYGRICCCTTAITMTQAEIDCQSQCDEVGQRDCFSDEFGEPLSLLSEPAAVA
eukprot:g6308.t1